MALVHASAELNFYNLETKTYEKKTIDEPLELISLMGNISHIDEKPLRIYMPLSELTNMKH